MFREMGLAKTVDIAGERGMKILDGKKYLKLLRKSGKGGIGPSISEALDEFLHTLRKRDFF